jgi:hypothetical protein
MINLLGTQGADTDRAMEHFDRNYDGRVSSDELFLGCVRAAPVRVPVTQRVRAEACARRVPQAEMERCRDRFLPRTAMAGWHRAAQ